MLKVGYPCITNPSATKSRRIPFDLHASSTPSAFNLNQDQILTEKKYLENLKLLLTSIFVVKQLNVALHKLYYYCLHIVFLILSKHDKYSTVFVILTNLSALFAVRCEKVKQYKKEKFSTTPFLLIISLLPLRPLFK